MKNENLRQTLLLLLALACLILVLSEPTADDNNWYTTLLITKALGFGIGYLCYYLINKWYLTSDEHVQD